MLARAPDLVPDLGYRDGKFLVAHGVRARQAQAGLLPVLFGEEEAREAVKARLALEPSVRKEWGRRRCLLPIGIILRILD